MTCTLSQSHCVAVTLHRSAYRESRLIVEMAQLFPFSRVAKSSSWMFSFVGDESNRRRYRRPEFFVMHERYFE